MQVHQMMAALSFGDAIGNEALRIQEILRSRGLRLRHLRRVGPPRNGRPGAKALGLPGSLLERRPPHPPFFHRRGRQHVRVPPSRPDSPHLPQHHSRSLVSGVSPPSRRALLPRASRAPGVRSQGPARGRRFGVQPLGARSGRLPPDGRPSAPPRFRPG